MVFSLKVYSKCTLSSDLKANLKPDDCEHSYTRHKEAFTALQILKECPEFRNTESLWQQRSTVIITNTASKYLNFTQFSGAKILLKGTVSAEFQANRHKNFHTRKVRKVSVFYVVDRQSSHEKIILILNVHDGIYYLST